MKEKTIIPKNLKQDAHEAMNVNVEDNEIQFLKEFENILNFQRNDGSFEGWFLNFTSMTWAKSREIPKL